MSDTFTYWRDAAGRYRWKLVSPNGRVIDASSQGFTRKWSAKRNALLTTRRMAAVLSGWSRG